MVRLLPAFETRASPIRMYRKRSFATGGRGPSMNQRPHLAEGETTLISGAAGTPRRGELKNINRAWPDLH